MTRGDHVLIHLTLTPEDDQHLPVPSFGDELAEYVRALLETLDAPPVVVGASPNELTLVAPLPHTMSTSHLVFCIKTGTERWLRQITQPRQFRWAPGYRAVSVDLRSLAITIRRIRRMTPAQRCQPRSRWIHEPNSSPP